MKRTLYNPFTQSLHLLYIEGRSLVLLTICLPKPLAGAGASRTTARGNQVISPTRDVGRIVHVT